MKKRYAVIAKARMQISGYVNKPESVNLQNNIIVDLENHPQREEVEEEWFYDAETNTFSKEGEVYYPEVEPTVYEPTQLDKIEAGLAYGNMMQEKGGM